MMVAVDVPYLKIMGDVTADLFKQIGLNLDYQAVDWTTVSQRRAKMEPPSAGGWNVYCIYDNGSNQLNPGIAFLVARQRQEMRLSVADEPERSKNCAAWFQAQEPRRAEEARRAHPVAGV